MNWFQKYKSATLQDNLWIVDCCRTALQGVGLQDPSMLLGLGMERIRAQEQGCWYSSRNY